MKVDPIITSIRVKFIHMLRSWRLTIEFSDFVTMVYSNDKNVRMSLFSSCNYYLTPDTLSPKYHIAKSRKNFPFDVKFAQPDKFLSDLKPFFNLCKDQTLYMSQNLHEGVFRPITLPAKRMGKTPMKCKLPVYFSKAKLSFYLFSPCMA